MCIHICVGDKRRVDGHLTPNAPCEGVVVVTQLRTRITCLALALAMAYLTARMGWWCAQLIAWWVWPEVPV